MNRVEHFVVLYRPGGPAPAWDVNAARRDLEALALRPRGTWHAVAAGPLLIGWLGEDAEPARAMLLGAGDLIVSAPDESEVARRLTSEPLGGEFPLDGTFAACAFDCQRQRATLVTDRFGIFPLFTHFRDGIHAYSTSLRALTTLARHEGKLDPLAVHEMLLVHLVVGDRTLLPDVKLVRPASVVHLHGEAPRTSTYWGWKRMTPPASTPRSEQDEVQHTYGLIEAAVLRAARGARQVGLPLSGGLDSRMIAAVLARHQVPFRAYNISFGRETPIARRVADVLRVPLTVLPMRPNPGRLLTAGHLAIDCHYEVNQTWGWELAERAAQDGCDRLLDGLAFDAILGAVHHVGGSDPVHLAAGIKGNYLETDVGTLGNVTGMAAARRIEEGVDASLLAVARECIEEAGPLASEYFLMTNRIRKFTFGWGLANLHHLPGAYPFVTRELFEHCMGLPAELRAQHRLYRRIYREVFPELARVPWAKTNLPLDQFAPPPENSRLFQLTQALVRRLSFGRLHLRGVDMLDEEIRHRPELRRPLQDLLGVSTGVSLGGAIPPETAGNALRLEDRGRNYAPLLLALYTVEHFRSRFEGTALSSPAAAGVRYTKNPDRAAARGDLPERTLI